MFYIQIELQTKRCTERKIKSKNNQYEKGGERLS